MPRIYIIILNYCGAQDTIACLESVLKISYPNYHIILVDNFSPDDSINVIQGWAQGKLAAKGYSEVFRMLIEPHVKKPLQYNFYHECDLMSFEKKSNDYDLTIIKAKSNRGFSAGNNIGLRYALSQGDADMFWLINNDTIVTPNSLDELVKCHQQYQTKENKIGIVGGKLLYYNEPETIQCLGGGTYNELLGIISLIGDRLPDNTANSNSHSRLSYVSGACMLVVTEFVKEVGLLAEDYFFYFEELDWCTRGRKKGWDIGYTDEAIIYHKLGATVSADQKKKAKSKMSDYYFIRSKLLYASKFNGLFVNIVVRMALLGTIINKVRRKQFRRVLMVAKLALMKY